MELCIRELCMTSGGRNICGSQSRVASLCKSSLLVEDEGPSVFLRAYTVVVELVEKPRDLSFRWRLPACQNLYAKDLGSQDPGFIRLRSPGLGRT